MPLTGNFKRSIDDKQRITIPKDLRTALGESVGKVFYMAPGTDRSLAVYDEASFERVASRLDSAPPTERDVRAFSRLFYAQAHRVEIDRQSRLRVPQQLADWAGLTKEAVLIGGGDHMELWDSAKWETYAAEKQSNYDELAEAAFSQSSHSN